MPILTTCWQVRKNSDDVFTLACIAGGNPIDLSIVTDVQLIHKSSDLIVSSADDPGLFLYPYGEYENVILCRFGMCDRVSSTHSGIWNAYLYSKNGKIHVGNILINIT
jgi:hypothetical protein